jgi:methylated-DNA-[protein]-cysteine S-methyltransferase
VFWTAVDGSLTGGERVRVYLAADEGRICQIRMDAEGHPCSEDEFVWGIGGAAAAKWPAGTGSRLLDAAAEQVIDYMAGRQIHFDLPLDYRGTSFQVSVWRSLTRIPFGETRSYGDVARMIGKPGAMRAVGQANSRNNLPLIVPCHRVVAAAGKIGGYTGGLSLKKALLAHETAVTAKRSHGASA